MLTSETKRNRRIVGALGRGSDLFESLTAVCEQHSVVCGELRAIGALVEAELAVYDQTRHQWLPRIFRYDSGLELVSLVGNISENAGATSFRAHAALAIGDEHRLVGGQLVRAQVFSVEFVIDAFDDLILRRHSDVATGLPQWKEAIPLGSPQRLPDNPTETLDRIDPARAANYEMVSTSEPRAPLQSPPPPAAPPFPAADTPIPDPGDIVMHPRFHRCVVQSVEDGEFLHVQLPSTRVVRLSLAFVKLKRIGDENGTAVYRATLP